MCISLQSHLANSLSPCFSRPAAPAVLDAILAIFFGAPAGADVPAAGVTNAADPAAAAAASADCFTAATVSSGVSSCNLG